MTETVDVYAACNQAIQSMNRWNLEEFGKLKMAKFDQINIIRTVIRMYQKSAQKARKRYQNVAYDAYLIGMYWCGVSDEKARKMADKAITSKWVDRVLSETDSVTLYRFDMEAERKAYRLAEALEVSPERSKEIEKALRLWSRQTGQYAINCTDYALIEAYKDYGLEMVQWITAKDERTCGECFPLDGKVFPIDEIPPKPHYGCRCILKPMLERK